MLKNLKGREVAKYLNIDPATYCRLLNNPDLTREWHQAIENAILTLACDKERQGD